MQLPCAVEQISAASGDYNTAVVHMLVPNVDRPAQALLANDVVGGQQEPRIRSHRLYDQAPAAN